MLDLSVVILSYNEEIHIQRCIESVTGIAQKVYLVDSFSTDRTIEIASGQGAEIYRKKWENNHSKQFNWALDHLPIRTKWVLRLDSDEYLTPELVEELKVKLPVLDQSITGVVLPLRRVFLNRTIKRGTGTVKLLRIFQYGKGRCEQRWMDEHIQLSEGETIEFTNEFADHNLNSLVWWTTKHRGYAIREAVVFLDLELGLLDKDNSNLRLSKHAAAKRRIKTRYARHHLFWRSFFYFVYRYFVRLGFLEGKEGFLWHFLQGCWYRMLVDAMIFEIKGACGTDREKIREYIKVNYSIEIPTS
jgi:glycosyltransferase involved in cell wall biosynthesis